MPPSPNVPSAQDLQSILAGVPVQIRQFIAAGGIQATAKDMMAAHQLHVDQGGILERELGLLLVGLTTPPEMATTLQTEANLSEDVVKSLFDDLSRKVFGPIRERMRADDKGAGPVGQQVRSSAPPPPPPVPAMQMPRPAAQMQRPVVPPPSPRPPANLPGVPFDHRLADHEESHIDFGPAQAPRPPMPMPRPAPTTQPSPISFRPPAPPVPPTPQQFRPTPPAPPGPMTPPVPMTPQMNVPRAIPQSPPPVGFKPLSPTPPQPPSTPKQDKSQSNDPYREPLEL